MAQESGYLPYLLFTEDMLPRGHSAEADAMLDDVKIMVFRHVR